jgi:hypothetical protein
MKGEVTWRIVRDLNERGVPTAHSKEWCVENSTYPALGCV